MTQKCYQPRAVFVKYGVYQNDLKVLVKSPVLGLATVPALWVQMGRPMLLGSLQSYL